MSDKIYDKSAATPEAWAKLASEQLKGKSPETLTWQTAEDIPVKRERAGGVADDQGGALDDVRHGYSRQLLEF